MTTLILASTLFAVWSLVTVASAADQGNTYQAKANGPGCSEASITSSSECQTAATSLGFTGELHVGNWNHAPRGCHVGHPTDGWAHIYFNENLNGKTGRSIYQSICRKINEALALGIAYPVTNVVPKTTEAPATTSQDVVLITGGYCGGCYDTVEVFGLASCSLSVTLPALTFMHSSHYIDGKVLICGGGYGYPSDSSFSASSTSTRCLQLIHGDFLIHSQLNNGRKCHSGVIIKGKLYLLGGFDSPWSMETLHGTTWTPGTVRSTYNDWYNKEMKHGLESSCVVALDNTRAMVIGGTTDNRHSGRIYDGWNHTAVYIYDGDDGWTTETSLPEDRKSHSCVMLKNGEVLVAGGDKELDWNNSVFNVLNTSLIYNGNTWEELAGRLNTPRSNGQMVKINGRILYFGGVDNEGNDLDTVEEFDEDTRTWTLLQETMETPRSFFSAVVVPASSIGCHP